MANLILKSSLLVLLLLPTLAQAADCTLESTNYAPKTGEKFELRWRSVPPETKLAEYGGEQPKFEAIIGKGAKQFSFAKAGFYNFSLEKPNHGAWNEGTCTVMVVVGYKPVSKGASLTATDPVVRDEGGPKSAVRLSVDSGGKKCGDLGAFTFVVGEPHVFYKLRSLNAAAPPYAEGPPGTHGKDTPDGERLVPEASIKGKCVVEFEAGFPRGVAGSVVLHVYRGYQHWLSSNFDGVDVVANALVMVKPAFLR